MSHIPDVITKNKAKKYSALYSRLRQKFRKNAEYLT
jgi:hypothetical protein